MRPVDSLLSASTSHMKRALDAAREEGYRMGLATCERAMYGGEEALFAVFQRAAPSDDAEPDSATASAPLGQREDDTRKGPRDE